MLSTKTLCEQNARLKPTLLPHPWNQFYFSLFSGSDTTEAPTEAQLVPDKIGRWPTCAVIFFTLCIALKCALTEVLSVCGKAAVSGGESHYNYFFLSGPQWLLERERWGDGVMLGRGGVLWFPVFFWVFFHFLFFLRWGSRYAVMLCSSGMGLFMTVQICVRLPKKNKKCRNILFL